MTGAQGYQMAITNYLTEFSELSLYPGGVEASITDTEQKYGGPLHLVRKSNMADWFVWAVNSLPVLAAR